MANILNWRNQLKIHTGDTIKIHQQITEGKKTRTQVFEWTVTRIKGHQGLKTFTVRRIASANVVVEAIFPEDTPAVIKIELIKRGRVRRAVLNYLKKRIGKKSSRIKEKQEHIESTPMPAPKKKKQQEKPEKIKKIKKGPKKITRKERHYTR